MVVLRCESGHVLKILFDSGGNLADVVTGWKKSEEQAFIGQGYSKCRWKQIWGNLGKEWGGRERSKSNLHVYGQLLLCCLPYGQASNGAPGG